VRHPGVGKGGREYGPPVALAEPRDDDDEFPPRRPFGVPARPVPPEPDDDDATPRPATSAGRGQPPATPS
jgi:hypothetical protein